MVLSLLLLILLLVEDCLCGGQERRLLNDLLTGYIKEARPTPTFDEPVVVVFGLDLQQIIDMDEQNQAGYKRAVVPNPVRITRNSCCGGNWRIFPALNPFKWSRSPTFAFAVLASRPSKPLADMNISQISSKQ